LEEIVVIELAITVKVKVVDHENEVLRRDLTVSVLPLKLTQLLGANKARCVSIESLESSVGLEVPDCRKNLSHFFDSQLLVSDKEQQLFQFQF
jgi:hypothetical protein